MNREGPGKIGYLDATWNPVVGCTHGCKWCWARRQAKRQRKNCQKCYDFTPHLHAERLDEPLRKREPSVIGVCFMGDLFDPALPVEDTVEVLNVMCAWRWPNAAARREGDESALEDPGHTFVVLTKRPERLLECFLWADQHWPGDAPLSVAREGGDGRLPPHIVLGVSVEDQASADRRIPELLECSAAKRIVSIEPMRGPVKLRPRGWLDGRDDLGGCTVCAMPNRCRCTPQFPSLDGVILGGQTGPDAVPMDPDWVRRVRDDCAAAGVPFYFKSWGKHVPRWAITRDPFGRNDRRMLDGRTHDEVAWTKGGKA
ncbi:MAG TPA: DUF5131 family protein [Phycisphaerae bacterium]|nr:DUF5131 family protein [Phycisphaerae bacterium]